MSSPNGEEVKSPDGQSAASAESKPFAITESISVPDRDLGPQEIGRIMRQISRLTSFLAGNIVRHQAIDRRPNTAGLTHPVVQNILNCAMQAEAAANSLEAPPPDIVTGPRPRQPAALPFRRQ